MSGKKLNCPEIWQPVNYFSELGHENRMSDFRSKIDKIRERFQVKIFFLENTIILAAKSKISETESK